jgi:hypothetical protein
LLPFLAPSFRSCTVPTPDALPRLTLEARDGPTWRTIATTTFSGGAAFLFRCATPTDWRLRDAQAGWVWWYSGGQLRRDTMSNNDAPAELFELWHREGDGDRWRKVGRAGSHGEALTMCRGKGDWHVRRVTPDRCEPVAAGAGTEEADEGT